MKFLSKISSFFCSTNKDKSSKVKDFGDFNGHRFEKETVKLLIKNGVKVIKEGARYDYNGKENNVEVDIETPKTAIEVKSSRGAKLEEQLKKYKDVLPNKEAIGYAPNIKKQHLNNLRKKHYNIFTDVDFLTDHLFLKGDMTKWGSRRYTKKYNRRHK